MTGSRLVALLDQATPGPWRIEDRDSSIAIYGRVVDGITRTLVAEFDTSYDVPLEREECENDAGLIALAPDMARLLVDMAAFVRGDTPDDECDVPGCTDPWCCDHDAEALLARFAALDEKAGGA